MRNILLLSCFALIAVAQFGCRSSAPANNSNSPAANSAANSNAQTAASETLPEFTDAPTALAEGNKLFDVNKTDLAILAYKKAVELDPNLGEAWFKLGIAQALIEKEKELESVNDQTEYTPTPTPSKKDAQAARTKDSEKSFENAVKAYKRLLAANTKDDAAHYNLGRAYEKLDEDEDALKSLREAVKLKPESTEYQTGLGSILIKLAQYDEAVRVLKKAIELDPENSQAEELLEKAEAGKKRINFSVTPKPQSTSAANTKPKTDDDAAAGDVPVTSTPKPKPSPPKLDKKGDQ
ncbi:MAG: tetratricopeptide repeat protein [Acidobacteria bacterium]|nr:tetratricopeptide repeat protein [Acidobacteriota bacterium]